MSLIAIIIFWRFYYALLAIGASFSRFMKRRKYWRKMTNNHSKALAHVAHIKSHPPSPSWPRCCGARQIELGYTLPLWDVQTSMNAPQDEALALSVAASDELRLGHRQGLWYRKKLDKASLTP
jgi:hypothetical protein